MGHDIQVIDAAKMRGHLTVKEIRELIGLLYKWDDARFMVVCCRDIGEMRERYHDKNLSANLRGEHRYAGGVHIITLVRENIEKAWQEKRAAGGNLPPPYAEVVGAMVLAHEIQHANQVRLHEPKASSTFYGGRKRNPRGGKPIPRVRYWDQACEREARLFVDERIDEICVYFGKPPVRRHPGPVAAGDEVAELARGLLACATVTPEDVRGELGRSGLLNPVAYGRVVELLRNSGHKGLEGFHIPG